MDWKDALGALKESGVLPEGGAEEAEAAEAVSGMARPSDKLKVGIDRRHRHGKTATIIEGFTCSDDELKEIARMLKNSLGIGGSCRQGEILLQGDCRGAAAGALRGKGYKVVEI